MAQDNFNVNDELLKLVQQQAQPQRQAVLNTGLLSGNQQNFGDVLRNPDQAQVNAGIAGVAALLSGRDAGRALVNSASAFGNTRQQTYENQLDANKIERESLRDRISGITSLAGVRSDDRKFKISEQQEKRDKTNFENQQTEVNVEQFADDKGQLISLFKRKITGEYEDNMGMPVDPSLLGLTPYRAPAKDNQAYLKNYYDVDLNKIENVKKLQLEALQYGDNNTYDNATKHIDNLVAGELGVNAEDFYKAVVSVNPNYKAQKENSEAARKLLILANREGAGIGSLQIRFASDFGPSNTKAHAELINFMKSASIPQRLNNFFAQAIQGKNAEATVQDYKDLSNVMLKYYNEQDEKSALSLEALGGSTNKSMAAALRKINQINSDGQTTNTSSLTPAELDRLKVLQAKFEAKNQNVGGLQ
jgi:uncharacterized protein (UPF0262 family)